MLALAYYVDRQVESGAIPHYAEAARLLGITRARLGQVMALLNLAAGIQEGILMGTLRVSERGLRVVAAEAVWEAQADILGGLLGVPVP